MNKPNLTHVVVLMLENRSFDHILGLLPGVNGIGNKPLTNLFNPGAAPSASNQSFAQGPGATFTTVGKNGPSHSLDGTSVQIFGNKAATGQARNVGFVLDYESALRADHVKATPPILGTIMKAFEVGRLPAIHALAQEFAVCDQWYSEVPGPTMPNRCYVHAATSAGFARNVFNHEFDVDTIYNRLEDVGKTWKVYFKDDNDLTQYTKVNSKRENFVTFDAFDADARAGKLPNYTFLTPQFASGKDGSLQDSMHAPGDVRPGDTLVGQVYEALRANEAAWNETLLIVTFDEHGGFADHVVPPAAVNPDGVDSPAPGDTAKFAPTFSFDRLGLRVPTILASPLIQKGKVISKKLQHTSILATLHDLWGTEPLTKRDAAAASFLDQFSNATRATPATLPSVDQSEGAFAARALDVTSPLHPANQPIDDVQDELVEGMRARLGNTPLASMSIKTHGDAHEFLLRGTLAILDARARQERLPVPTSSIRTALKIAVRPSALRNIRPEVLHAKQVASVQYLHGTATPGAVTAFAVSSLPAHNVVGVGCGFKVVGGKEQDEVSVRFYVQNKLNKGRVPPEHMLPSSIEGVPTDVIETGRFHPFALPHRGGRAQAAAAASPAEQQRHRPAQPGCSVGFAFTDPQKVGVVMAGTFGALVMDAAGRQYVLSNNHVLADQNALPVGSPIFQPGLLDGGNEAKDQIARLERFITLDPNGQNVVDAAIARVLNPRLVRGAPMPKVVLGSTTPIDAAEQMSVEKVGRTTGYTHGTVIDVAADVTVNYDLGPLRFTDQVLVVGSARPFSDAGDSGSLIVDRHSKQATALLFAGSSSHTIANHLELVLQLLGVNLVE